MKTDNWLALFRPVILLLPSNEYPYPSRDRILPTQIYTYDKPGQSVFIQHGLHHPGVTLNSFPAQLHQGSGSSCLRSAPGAGVPKWSFAMSKMSEECS